jgi:RNA polymerase sigma-70 factor (ECF subfamily)
MDDHAACVRVRRGDLGGLEPLVRRYQLRALRAAYLVARDRALAEEIVQEAFLRLPSSLRTFDDSRPFGPWFLRSVVNAALRAVERAERTVRLEPALLDAAPRELVDPAPDPAAFAERTEARAALWAALGRLTTRERAAVVLHYFLELGVAESADRLGVPPGTVKRRLHDARRRLRALLGPSL